MSELILATNIQRFSLHDGPGIRTTVFLKGCSLRCPWCSNPENMNPEMERYTKDGREGVYGKWLSCNEIYQEIMKDRIFYEVEPGGTGVLDVSGGVTFSGGEPLLQAEALVPLLERLTESGIHICAESALFVPDVLLRLAIKYIQLFYVDVKILDENRCREVLHGNLRLYEKNVEELFSAGKLVVFRVPVIGGFTNDAGNQKKIAAFLKRYRPIKVELIKEHNLGRNKYLSLGRQALELNSVTDEDIRSFQRLVQDQTGVETEICKV